MKGENMNNTKLFTVSFLATLLIISSLPLYLYLNNPESSDQIALNKFSSYEELKNFLETASSSLPYNFWVRDGDAMLESGEFSVQVTTPEPAPSVPMETSETADSDYSKTNIQVEGVDEADIVKTDGEYIYIVSGGNITIVKAYPPEEAKVLSKITVEGSITGIFINGDKLAVFETEYGIYPLYEVGVAYDLGSSSEGVNESTEDDETVSVPPPVNGSTPSSPVEEPRTEPEPKNGSKPDDEPRVPESTEPVVEPEIIWEPPTTSIKVYDISNKANPVLTRNFSVDGNYFSSRMIGDYVYVVATQYTFFIDTDVFLPRVHSNNETEVIAADDIYYYNFSDSSYSFTTIVALNIQNDAQEPTHETILLGSTSNIYVSQNNIYLTFTDYTWRENETTKTTIQRIKIDKRAITFAAQGEVPGYVLNQFSMDEHNGYFRIATTTDNFGWRTFAESEVTSKNNVYVLDMNLNVVGKLEELAPGEQIYSARFMGDRCYVVTFRNIDPLFVIDLSNPTAPTVLGQLKVTGYSGYLHPYDENHIIGIGKETEYEAKEDFSWYQGVKISLFDVSDVSNPVELAKYEIGDRGTQSPVLDDHKALLFDKENNLLVIPVLVAELDESDYDGEVPDWAYGEYVWQGAYVFDISLDGIELRGRITHMEDNADLLKSGYYFGSYYTVQRALYIDDVLYTISSMKVKMNNLETLAEINEVDIS
jgi:inhibitor of cysteine peptidase